MKSLRLFLTVAAAATLFAQSASAATIVQGFTLSFGSGNLSGNSYMGDFSYDDSFVNASGPSVLFPSNNSLLSFDVTVAGTDFAMMDDDAFDNFPQVLFNDGVVTGVDYFSAQPLPGLDIFSDGSVRYGDLPDGNDISEGKITFKDRVPPTNGVPEGGTTALLMGLALTGLAMARRRLG